MFPNYCSTSQAHLKSAQIENADWYYDYNNEVLYLLDQNRAVLGEDTSVKRKFISLISLHKPNRATAYEIALQLGLELICDSYKRFSPEVGYYFDMQNKTSENT